MSRKTRLEPRGTGWRRFRVRAWLALLAAGVIVVTAGLAALSQRSYTDLSAARDSLARSADPAVAVSLRLANAVLAQDTAVDRYVITAQSAALNAYQRARTDTEVAITQLRDLIPVMAERAVRDRARTDLAAVEDAVESWRSGYAEPTISAVAASGPLAIEIPAVQEGQSRFDTVQAALSRLDAGLAQARQAQLDRVYRSAEWFERIAVGGLLVFLVALIAVAVTTRQTVIRPLALLSKRVRQIARGDYDLPLEVEGAVEIRRLVADVDAMRQRILLELDESTASREQLDIQTLELRRSNADLEQFAYVASHDLREPLRKVASFCQLLERRYADQLDERGRQYIAFAVDGATRMQVLINDLLTFSRVGQSSEGFEPVDCGQALERVRGLLSGSLEEAGASVESTPLPEVYGDPLLVEQLFQNLLSNAVKFRREDVPAQIRFSAELHDGMWQFTCADNGIGIEPEYADRIFVIFQRLHPRDRYTGTGIGLALCKKIVEYHGGRIWLDTNGQRTSGTVFQFTLPAIPDEALAPGAKLGSDTPTENVAPARSTAAAGG